jgi:hypothetical protein
MLPDTATITAIPDQTSVDLEDEAAILHLKSGVYFGLNEVGAFIWRLLQQPRTVGEVRAAILAAYEVSPEQASHDLHALLAELRQHELIDVRDAGSNAPGA